MPITLSESKDQCLKEERKLKQCKFPGCEIHFEGRGLEKYCKEHRKKEYYRILYFDKYKKENEPSITELKKNNQIIKHKSCHTFTVNSICALEGCNNHFKINVTPGNFVYPKFCPEHRNEFKRKMFVERNKK